MASTASHRYIALLRGINLGSRNRVPMAALRDLCSALGATNVRTYIASGNVVLDSGLSAIDLRERLEDGIQKEFGISIAVVVLTRLELKAVIENNPFPTAEPGTLHAAFALDKIDKKDLERLVALDFPPEELRVVGRQIYYHVPKGFGLAQLPKEVDRLRIRTTVRNWRTVLALKELVSDSA